MKSVLGFCSRGGPNVSVSDDDGIRDAAIPHTPSHSDLTLFDFSSHILAQNFTMVNRQIA